MSTIGFTGTQDGMTLRQSRSLTIILRCSFDALIALEQTAYFSHGDCVGSDEQAHAVASQIGYRIIIHPPTNPAKRAFCSNEAVMWEPLPYLDRNREIVKESLYLIATPKSKQEERRSGTWSTVRYAKTIGTPYLILNP